MLQEIIWISISVFILDVHSLGARHWSNPTKIGRVVLKYLSDDYLLNDKLTAADATDL